MAWQKTTVTTYRDVLNRLVQMATSKNVTAVAINNAGTGYVAGEILTVPHAGAIMAATVEVLTVGGGGAITSVKLRDYGAYSNRLATVAVNAGGTGYPASTTIFLAISGGTFTQAGKVSATTNGSGVVTAVSIFEGGGAYTSAPAGTGAATSIVGPSTATTGSGCTINTTMTGLVGTSGVATTASAAGTGATLNLTLTDGGWSAVRDLNNYSFNSVNDEKEVFLQGTVSSGDEPYCGYRTYTATVGINTRYGIVLVGATSHNIGIAFGSQSGIGPTTGTPNQTSGSYVLLLNSSMDVWLATTPRKISGVVKTQGSSVLAYQSFYTGHLNPFGTATENPFPMFIAGSSAIHDTAPDAASNAVTGLTEALSPSSSTGPLSYFRSSDLTWQEVKNSENGTTSSVNTIYPIGQIQNVTTSGTGEGNIIVNSTISEWWNGIALNSGAVATKRLLPSPMTGGDLFLLVPATLIRTPDASSNLVGDDVHGELDGVYWLSATKSDGTTITVEDTLTQSGVRYRVFACAHRRERYSFFALAEQ